jgi:predicted PurR-regulated permease PerM
LALGILLFEVFRFSEINIILSMFLSVIAFIPLVRPSMVALVIAATKIWLSGYYVTPIICWIIYAYFSGVIYEKYYANVSLHKVIINLSVVFGIYQYGVTGIFYGPLLILLFQCVYEELFKNKKH